MYSILAMTEQGAESGLSGGEKLALGGLFAGLAFFWLLVMVLALVFFIFWITMIIDAAQRPEKDFKKIGSGEKSLWIIILIVSMFFGMGWLAAILYYIIIKKKVKK